MTLGHQELWEGQLCFGGHWKLNRSRIPGRKLLVTHRGPRKHCVHFAGFWTGADWWRCLDTEHLRSAGWIWCLTIPATKLMPPSPTFFDLVFTHAFPIVRNYTKKNPWLSASNRKCHQDKHWGPRWGNQPRNEGGSHGAGNGKHL